MVTDVNGFGIFIIDCCTILCSLIFCLNFLEQSYLLKLNFLGILICNITFKLEEYYGWNFFRVNGWIVDECSRCF